MPRHLIRLALSFLVWLAALSLFLVALLTRAEALRGIEDPLTAKELPLSVPRLGVNAELTTLDDAQLHAQLNLMQQAGVVWVRHTFYWDQIEPHRGDFSWQDTDRIIQAIAQHPPLELVAVLQNSPQWAITPQAQDPTGPPANPDDFGQFAAAFSQRYANHIRYYQIWDEPNLFTQWGRIPPRPAHYAALLEAAYPAIHAADPDASVISAALAPTIELGPDNLSDWLFLQDLYALKANVFFDAVGAKPYGFNTSPDDRQVRSDLLNFSRVIGLREIMLAHNDAAKPIWASHWGWNHLPPNWAGQPSIWGAVSQSQQIDYTLAALSRVEGEWPWMAGMILHHWNPPYPSNHPQHGFALTTPTGQPTALLDALIARAARQPHGAGVGWHPAQTPYAAYSGVWTFSPTGADIGWLNDSRLTFQFVGEAVGLRLRQADYVAHLYVWVDDRPANALPVDAAGNAHLSLMSGSRSPTQDTVAVAHALPNAPHTLGAIADRGFDRYALVGYAVGMGYPTAGEDAATAVTALTFTITTLALIINAAGLPWGAWNRRASRLWLSLTTPLQYLFAALTSIALMIASLMTWGQDNPALVRRDTLPLAAALLSVGIAYLNLALPLSLLALAVLAWCIYQRLLIGLGLTILFAPFFLFPVELYRYAIPMAELILILTVGMTTLHALARCGRARRLQTPPISVQVRAMDIMMLAYVGLGGLALTWSTYLPPALTEFRTLFVEPALLYAVYRFCAPTEHERRALGWILLVAGVAVCAVSLAQALTGQALITAEGAAQRLAGVYGSPNNLALFLGRVLPLALAAAQLARERITRITGWILVCGFGITILLTQSVGALLLGIPTAFATVQLLIHGRRGCLTSLVTIALVGTAFAALAAHSDRFARALDFSQGTNFYRVRVMQSAWQAITDHPITGLGPDQFLYAFRDRYRYPDAWQEPNLSHPHNILLDVWTRLGIGGVGLLIAWMSSIHRAARHALKRPANPPDWLTIGLVASLTYTLAHGLVDNSIFVVDLALIFALSIALIDVNPSAARRSHHTP